MTARVALHFAYGANLLHEHMRSVCPDARPIGRACLEGWRRVFRRVLTIEPAPGASLHGALWETSLDDEGRLDAIEAYPEWYEKGLVEVRTKDRGATAYVYVMRASRVPVQAPDPAYLATCLRGAREWGIHDAELLGPARLASERGASVAQADWPWDESMWRKYVR